MDSKVKNQFIRGTTPTHIFKLPIDTNTIDQLRITYHQLGKTVLELTQEDVEIKEGKISYTLTQEQSFQFTSGHNVDIQIKVLTTMGIVMASQIMSVSVDKVLNTEVLT